MMKNEIITWIRKKGNWDLILIVVLLIALGTYKYGFFAAIIGTAIIILFGFVVGFVINKFIG